MKLAILSALALWANRSAEAVKPEMVSFISTGLKEKEALRRGHLRCLRVICKNPDTLTKVSKFFMGLKLPPRLLNAY